MFAVDKSQAQACIPRVNIFEFLGPRQRVRADHYQVFQTRCAIRSEFRLSRLRDGYIDGSSARRTVHRLERDVSENSIFVGTSEVVGEYELSFDLLLVTTKRCRRE